jgi:hypothetical protein
MPRREVRMPGERRRRSARLPVFFCSPPATHWRVSQSSWTGEVPMSVVSDTQQGVLWSRLSRRAHLLDQPLEFRPEVGGGVRRHAAVAVSSPFVACHFCVKRRLAASLRITSPQVGALFVSFVRGVFLKRPGQGRIGIVPKRLHRLRRGRSTSPGTGPKGPFLPRACRKRRAQAAQGVLGLQGPLTAKGSPAGSPAPRQEPLGPWGPCVAPDSRIRGCYLRCPVSGAHAFGGGVGAGS